MSKSIRTLVLGASTNPSRYSNLVTRRLLQEGHEPIPVGLRKGEISDIDILIGQPDIKDVHTITMYISPKHQPPLYDYILGLNPKRIIFNPGTENSELAKNAREHGILVEEACTLVMLSLGSFAKGEVLEY